MTKVRKLTISIPEDLYQRVKKMKEGNWTLNLSKVCREAIEKELRKVEK
jgi:predicted CopG family antitoxin